MVVEESLLSVMLLFILINTLPSQPYLPSYHDQDVSAEEEKEARVSSPLMVSMARFGVTAARRDD